MIYKSDDYIEKYCDVISYLIGRSFSDGYSPSYIERNIAYSLPISEFEKSNVTLIAFSSLEKIYSQVFPDSVNQGYSLNRYDEFGWVGYIYVHLFLDLEFTFELLFILLPIEKALEMYHLYHEMDYSQTLEYVKELVKYSPLDAVMKYRNISTRKLSEMVGMSFSTINALRYGKRNIEKCEVRKLLNISIVLSVKMETLINNISLLDKDRAMVEFLQLGGCLKPYDDGKPYEEIIAEEILKK